MIGFIASIKCIPLFIVINFLVKIIKWSDSNEETDHN